MAANRLQLPNDRPEARPIEGGEEVVYAKKMVVPTRLGPERPPELARDGLACRPREEVGLHGHLGAKSLPGACRGVNNTRGEEGGDWRAEEWAVKGFERTLFDALTRPN